ncbi:VOC family protein [Paraconexibacter sp.]|uniref:VOC family protein n=1 Tax=Paraconexibacter sp. TaxID=2949640 RepID=UPI00356168E5
MIQHVGLEIRAEKADAEVAFWGLLGFAEVAPPEPSLGERSRWVEDAAGFQIHLLWSDSPAVPDTGHVAVVAGWRFDEIVAALRAAGHEAAPRQEYWGSPRTQVVSPAGHRVEVMATPPRRD